MTSPDKPASSLPADREARLKAALKANIARRKAQARGRAGDGQDDPTPPAPGTDGNDNNGQNGS